MSKSAPTSIARASNQVQRGRRVAITVDRTAQTRVRGGDGVEFSIGGEITVTDTTPDGLYTGDFVVTAEYQ